MSNLKRKKLEKLANFHSSICDIKTGICQLYAKMPTKQHMGGTCPQASLKTATV